MGRVKLELKFREQSRARMNTYKTRIKGMEKKAEELSVLCGIDVMFLSFSPDLNIIQCWPPKEQSDNFHRIVNRFKSVSLTEQLHEVVSSPPVNSSSHQKELAALNKKLEEVSQRLKSLEAEKAEYSSQNGRADSIEVSGDCCSCASTLSDDEYIFSELEMIGEEVFISDLPSDSPAYVCNETFFDWAIVCTDSFFDANVLPSDLGDVAL